MSSNPDHDDDQELRNDRFLAEGIVPPTVKAIEKPLAALLATLAKAQNPAALNARYRRVRELGRGGMGVVWLAHDEQLDRPVAIKELTSLGTEAIARLRREARTIAQVNHPNVVAVFDVDADAHPPHIVMEFVEGCTLRRYLEDNPDLGWKKRVRVYRQAGAALQAAHALGLVHRDFKPDNAMITTRGRVQVLDFGLAKPVDAALVTAEAGPDADVTQGNMILGTPAYMSPEQSEGEDAVPEDDVFAFGVSLWEAVYGRRPYEARSLMAMLEAKQAGPPGAPYEPRVPSRVHAVIARALAPKRDDRWPSMQAMLRALDRAMRPRRAPWVVVGATCMLAFALLPSAEAPEPCVQSLRAHEARTAEVGDSALASYAAWWSDAYARACAAPRTRNSVQRMVCLEAEHARVVEAGSSAVAPKPSPCLDTEEMWIEPRPAAFAAELDALDAYAHRKELANLLGAPSPADLEQKLTRAREIGYRPTLARLLALEARTAKHLPLEVREERLLESVKLAESSGAYRIASWNAATLTEMTHRAGRDRRESDAWLHAAYAALDQIQPRGDALLHVATCHALVALERGDPHEALEVIEGALTWAPDDADPVYLAFAEGRRAVALNALGRRRDAAEQLRAIVDESIERGASDAATSNRLGNLGVVLGAAGEDDGAIEVFEQQLALIERLEMGAEDRTFAEINIARAFALRPRTRPRAVELLRASVERSELGTDTHARAAFSLAEALARSGQLEAAAKALQTAKLSVDLVFGPDSGYAEDVQVGLENLGNPDGPF